MPRPVKGQGKISWLFRKHQAKHACIDVIIDIFHAGRTDIKALQTLTALPDKNKPLSPALIWSGKEAFRSQAIHHDQHATSTADSAAIR